MYKTKIPAVPKPQNTTKLHRIVPVTMKNGTVRQCRGGIDVAPVLQHFSEALNPFFFSSYLSSLPCPCPVCSGPLQHHMQQLATTLNR